MLDAPLTLLGAIGAVLTRTDAQLLAAAGALALVLIAVRALRGSRPTAAPVLAAVSSPETPAVQAPAMTAPPRERPRPPSNELLGPCRSLSSLDELPIAADVIASRKRANVFDAPTEVVEVLPFDTPTGVYPTPFPLLCEERERRARRAHVIRRPRSR